jgi:hypothetical protein
MSRADSQRRENLPICPSCSPPNSSWSSTFTPLDYSAKILAPGPRCLAPTPQLKRESSLVASFGRANGNYHNISNTWRAHGFLSSNPLSPFFMSSEQFCTDSHWQWALGEGQVALSYTLA